jgi:hypothetical protein
MFTERRGTAMAVGLTLAVSLILALTVAIGAGPGGIAYGASTAKSLSTNFTLLNFGSVTATVAAQYLKDDGSAWASVPAGFTSFTLAPNGGQGIFRQYDPFAGSMGTGRGSVVVSSDQPLGAVAQILARGQTPTSGAYSGINQTSSTYYVPLSMRRRSTASGLSNSQIMIQNAGGSSASVQVQFLGTLGTTDYTKPSFSILPGVTYYYDLDDETNLPVGWVGSAIVSASGGGQLAVVVNLFSGADTLQTYNAFRAESLGTNWVVPLFTSRLANGLSTPIAVQNLSGGTIAVGAVAVNCTKDVSIPGSNFTMTNTTQILSNAAYYFNPVTDTTIPAPWQGSCWIASSGNIVAFVQMRQIGTSNAGAYEAINAGGTDKKMLVPLVAKRLANGFATVVTIQNLHATNTAHVTLTYVPSPEYVSAGGSAVNIVVGPLDIAGGASLIRNHRLEAGPAAETGLLNGWQGTLAVSSADQPIDGFVQLTNVLITTGDTFMAHNAFTQP